MIEKIFILHHTHVDLGYTDFQEKCYDKLVDMIDRVTELVEASRSRPQSQQFRWVHEVSWPVIEYLRRGGTRRRDLFQQMRDGLTELTALYVNPTDMFDRETFEITTDYACHLARMHNLPLTTAMFNDSPGISWCMPDILAQRGIRYLSTAPNPIMGHPLEVSRPFYWEGPEGGRVLTWFSREGDNWFGSQAPGESSYLGAVLFYPKVGDFQADTERVLHYLERIEQQGYPWRALAINVCLDNAQPLPKLMDFVKYFNKTQTQRQACLAINRDFFEFMEQHHADQFPVLRAAWPDWWANGNVSAAFETACSRQTKVVLNRCRAAARAFNAPLEEPRVHEIRNQMVYYDEHTFGHDDANTVYPTPWDAAARGQWAYKRVYAHAALTLACRMEQDVISAMRDGCDVVVANPYDTDWTGVLRLSALDGKRQNPDAPCLRDVENGALTSGQRTRPGQSADVPSDYYLVTVPGRGIRRWKRDSHRADATSERPPLHSEHFRLAYDECSGAISDITAEQLGVHLHDPQSPWSFAEIIHECAPEQSRNEIIYWGLGSTAQQPKLVRTAAHVSPGTVMVTQGNVFDSLVTQGELPGVTFKREVRLFHGTPRIDIVLRLDKAIVTDYESLYLAFPFPLDHPEIWVENAGAAYRVGQDQLPGSATDWQSVDQYVAVTDQKRTIILVPHHSPLVQVNDINTCKWQRQMLVERGYVFSWLMNNMWYVNFPLYQEGMVELQWSLTAHKGAFNQQRAQAFAHETRVAVLASGVSYGSLLILA